MPVSMESLPRPGPAEVPSRVSPQLWRYMTRKPTQPSALLVADAVPNLPLAPSDRAATSMRVLLHDTQATLEKFSDRLDQLACKLAESQRDIHTVQKLFQEDRETSFKDIVDLVNRCQTEMQKSVGTPAQAFKLDELQKDQLSTDRRVDALDRKLDTHQFLIQSQSQTLQTQTQALQTLQEQQNQTLTTLAPLLPLLQAVPLHIDTARAALADVIRTEISRCIAVITSHVPDQRQNSTGHASQSEEISSSKVQQRMSFVSTDRQPPRKRSRLEEHSPSIPTSQPPFSDVLNRAPSSTDPLINNRYTASVSSSAVDNLSNPSHPLLLADDASRGRPYSASSSSPLSTRKISRQPTLTSHQPQPASHHDISTPHYTSTPYPHPSNTSRPITGTDAISSSTNAPPTDSKAIQHQHHQTIASYDKGKESPLITAPHSPEIIMFTTASAQQPMNPSPSRPILKHEPQYREDPQLGVDHPAPAQTVPRRAKPISLKDLRAQVQLRGAASFNQLWSGSGMQRFVPPVNANANANANANTNVQDALGMDRSVDDVDGRGDRDGEDILQGEGSSLDIELSFEM